jgi:hypothetical protein
LIKYKNASSVLGLYVESKRIENSRDFYLIYSFKRLTLCPIIINKLIEDFLIFSKKSFALISFYSPIPFPRSSKTINKSLFFLTILVKK